ncbi:MAG: hypothetical protein V2I67_16075 [Thermoanaerobaculales bacterium]|nr:hypothetical protein [Thermoanaerobaculales bacterium]
MRRFAMCAALLIVVAGFAGADVKEPDTVDYMVMIEADSTPGNLDGSNTFDRRFLVTYDGTCAAASSDSSNDGVSYEVFPIWSTVDEALEAEVVLGSLSDSVLFLYCDPFDPMNPEVNLVAWDDDDGAGFGSAFTPADGYMITANTQYYLVVTGYGNASLGDYTLTMGGDAVFGQPATPTPTGPQPVPTTSRTGMIILVAALALVAFALLRSRSA